MGSDTLFDFFQDRIMSGVVAFEIVTRGALVENMRETLFFTTQLASI